MKEIQINKELPVITMNFDEVKGSLQETMKKYEGIIVTEEGLKDCKATQRDLASLRTKIDNYRKDIKREMEAPIKDFEGSCKELISLISDVEKPIKEGIKVFDDKRREEKKEKVLEIINVAIKDFELEKEFAYKLDLKDSYLKLTGSIKSIKEDVEMRAMMLKREQEDKKTRIKMLEVAVKNEIDRVNETINTKLDYEKFKVYVLKDYPLEKILNEINKQYEIILNAENNTKQEIKKEKESIQVPLDFSSKKNEELKKEVKEDKFFVDIHVEHNLNMIQALSKFLKENRYDYEVHNKGKVK
ncbi:DUF1351 domain-containing protein [Clostridium sp. Ade.TY]|uniref:DUF1351 domain-containing protein n=1 Tax=Clostridium sp. Ade.TY TaxID=1391647 RepID=UPI00040214A1|nr:DUF1351 domain-containing protein [Clostridium sp. Ade.TY]